MIRKNLCVVGKETEHQAGPDNPQVCSIARGRDKNQTEALQNQIAIQYFFFFFISWFAQFSFQTKHSVHLSSLLFSSFIFPF